MKFVFFGYDHSVDIAVRLIQEGHGLMAIYTFPCDNMFAFNLEIQAFARAIDVPVFDTPITVQDIEDLTAQGCELFFSCGYPYKIPPIDFSRAYGVNLHPSLLPRVRSVMPTPYIILHEPTAAGLTLHKLSQEFDSGDILAQKPVAIDAQTDVEVLNARLGMASPDFAAEIVRHLPEYWAKAAPQDESKASHYPLPREEIRVLDWTKTAEELNRMGRAFGRFGTVATVRDRNGEIQKLVVFQSNAWKEAHSHAAGEILRSSLREVVIAVNDGYICLKEFQIMQSP